MKRAFDVITIGSGVIDHYVSSHDFDMETCFQMGGKVPCDDIVLDTGGGATNSAVTFANLGLKTSAVFRVGDDHFGPILTETMRDVRVNTDFVQTDKKLKTGQSIVLLSGTGHRSIITYRGAGAELDARSISWTKLDTDWFYVSSLAGNTGLVRMILDRAEKSDSRVAWNPGGGELKKGLATLKPHAERVDILNLNREEAAELADIAPRHLNRILKKLGDLPRVALVITDGPKGAYLHSRGCTWYAPPLPGRRVNTTGAGDALGSGLVAGFAQTCDLVTGLKLGMLNALGVIMKMGAKNGILETWPSDRELNRVKIRPAKLEN